MISVYIHIPFCKKICSYCDFCKFYYNDNLVDDYLDCLYKEIKKRYHNELVKTIYIGGGTPSCLSKKQLERLFDIVDLFNKDNLIEFSFEANIEDISEELLLFLKSRGVNRLSIGIQSFNQELLKTLGRHYDNDYVKKLRLSKKYMDVNVDLIYAIPGETLEDLNNDLDILLSLDIDHISCYSLIIEEHTMLYIDNISNIDEELDYKMYQLINDRLKDYSHYEISNYAKEGKESVHNLTYWNNEYYYGFGLGSSGYIDGSRYDNTRSINKYIKGNYILSNKKIDFNEKVENEFILGLRKIKGINKKHFFNKYHINIKDIDIVLYLLKCGKLKENSDYIYIPRHLLYTSNEILVNFLGIDYKNIV